MIEVLRECGALKVLLPEVNALFGVPQRADYHPEIDSGIHTLMTLQRAADMGLSLPERYAALLHDLGKAKHRPTSCRATTDTTSPVSNPCAKSISGCVRRNIAPSLPNWFAVGTLFSTKSDSLKPNHSERIEKPMLPPSRTLSDGIERLHCRHARPSEPRTHALPATRTLVRPARSRQSGGFGQNRRRMPRAGKSAPYRRTNRPGAAGTNRPIAKNVSSGARQNRKTLKRPMQPLL